MSALAWIILLLVILAAIVVVVAWFYERATNEVSLVRTGIGGLKVVTANGWFAARPSGTEQIYKIYAESFKGQGHLDRIQAEAQEIVKTAFTSAGL